MGEYCRGSRIGPGQRCAAIRFDVPAAHNGERRQDGQTASGAVWLNADKLSPYDYWQYWRNTEDMDVGRFMRLFTELSLDEIAEIEKLEGAEINEAKIKLGHEATRMCHGDDAAQAAEETARRTFVEGGSGEDLPRRNRKGSLSAAFRFMSDARGRFGEEQRRSAPSYKGWRWAIERYSDFGGDGIGYLEDLNAEGVLKLSAGRKRHVGRSQLDRNTNWLVS